MMTESEPVPKGSPTAIRLVRARARARVRARVAPPELDARPHEGYASQHEDEGVLGSDAARLEDLLRVRVRLRLRLRLRRVG